MDRWWQHCTHCLAGGHAPRFCALQLVQYGVRFCHSRCKTALYHQVPSEKESKTSRNFVCAVSPKDVWLEGAACCCVCRSSASVSLVRKHIPRANSVL
jgi:hypothetical protein